MKGLIFYNSRLIKTIPAVVVSYIETVTVWRRAEYDYVMEELICIFKKMMRPIKQLSGKDCS